MSQKLRQGLKTTLAEKIEDFEGEMEIFPDLFKDRYWPIIFGSNRYIEDKIESFNDETLKELSRDEFSNKIGQDNISADQARESEPLEQPIVWYPFRSSRRSFFISFQKWRGVVLKVFKDSFFARLVDMDETMADEEAEILISEVSDEDISNIEPGAVFYWNIGYHVNPSGQRKRASIIRFRRLPVWKDDELNEAELKAEHIRKLFSLD